MVILKALGFLKLSIDMNGDPTTYQGLTGLGVNKAIDVEIPDSIDLAIHALKKKMEFLDYVSKKDDERYEILRIWVNQFETIKDKWYSLFLFENLLILSNQECYKTFLDNIKSIIDADGEKNVFFFAAAGTPGCSGESWRHKIVRSLTEGKAQSISIDDIKTPKNISWEGKTIIFIDDTIGSGNQFVEFFTNTFFFSDQSQKTILPHLNKTKFYYVGKD
nr:hypothetical protein [Candidatus Sigynarchaeum springense]